MRQATEKVYANHTPDKGLIVKIYKRQKQLDSKNTVRFKNKHRNSVDISQNNSYAQPKDI